MKKLIGLSLVGVAFALLLAFGIPGKTNTFANAASGRLILVDDVGVTLGGGGVGIDIEKDHPEHHERYKRDRDFDRDRDHEWDREHHRDWDRDRDLDRDWDYDRY